MDWINIKKSELVGIECINPTNNKYAIELTPNSKNLNIYKDSEEYIRIVLIKINNEPVLSDIKNILISLQKEYDASNEVNCFILNGKRVWLDNLTRIKILNNLNNKTNTSTKTILWFDDNFIELEVSKAITLLKTVDDYSKKCYDNTHKHYVEINQLNSIEDCLQYDITAGYPAILNIQIQ